MSDVNFSGKAHALDDDKSKEQAEKLAKTQAKEAADKEAAKKAREAASKSAEKAAESAASAAKKAAGAAGSAASKSVSSELGKEVIEGGAALLGTALESSVKAAGKGGKGSKSGGGAMDFKHIVILVIIAAAIIGVIIAAWPKISSYLGLNGNTTVAADISQSQALSITSIDFSNTILKEARQEQKLVVLEQDVQTDTEISSELAGLAVFKKTKTVHTYGTGVYTVDMSQVTEDSIKVDDSAKTVTIYIPRTHLSYITGDLEKTEFEDTDHALLAFGDLKLTQEQQNALEQFEQNAMREVLISADQYAKADEYAHASVYDTYQPIVAQLSDQYTLETAFADGSANADDSGNVYQSSTSTSAK